MARGPRVALCMEGAHKLCASRHNWPVCVAWLAHGPRPQSWAWTWNLTLYRTCEPACQRAAPLPLLTLIDAVLRSGRHASLAHLSGWRESGTPVGMALTTAFTAPVWSPGKHRTFRLRWVVLCLVCAQSTLHQQDWQSLSTAAYPRKRPTRNTASSGVYRCTNASESPRAIETARESRQLFKGLCP